MTTRRLDVTSAKRNACGHRHTTIHPHKTINPSTTTMISAASRHVLTTASTSVGGGRNGLANLLSVRSMSSIPSTMKVRVSTLLACTWCEANGSMQFCGLFRLRKWPPAAAAALVRPIPILLGMRSYLRQSATKPSYTILRSLIFSSSRILCSHLGWIWATMKIV